METKTVITVPCSSLFSDCPEARSQFNSGNFNVSFGDAHHTLIDSDQFLGMMADVELTEQDLKENDHPMAMQVLCQVKTIHARLDGVTDSIFIDLEN